MSRGKGATTLRIEGVLRDVLAAHNPMTVRQAYYQLVSRQVIENTRSKYQAVSNILVSMRQEGSIPWEWIEDRMRRPRSVSMWDGLPDFAESAVNAYRRNVWADQEQLVELWVEKDALSGIFEDVARPYGVTVNVGRGYDGWSSIRNAAVRYLAEDRPVSVLYFGDFDPSGEDMYRSIQERLAFFETWPELVKVALTPNDRAKLPQNKLDKAKSKGRETFERAFIKKWGNKYVELDALPVEVLRERIRTEIEKRMDLEALATTHEQEDQERERIRSALEGTA